MNKRLSIFALIMICAIDKRASLGFSFLYQITDKWKGFSEFQYTDSDAFCRNSVYSGSRIPLSKSRQVFAGRDGCIIYHSTIYP